MSLDFKWRYAVFLLGMGSMWRSNTKYTKMPFRKRFQNNIIDFKKGVVNKEKINAEERLKNLIASIDEKRQQPYWDVVLFDDKELELLSNFGETIKFPSDNTAPRAASVLATFILKKYAEDDYE